MSSKDAIYVIVEFPVALTCAKEALGAKTKVTVGGYNGVFQLPFPAKIEALEGVDALRSPLIAPVGAKKWKNGEESIFWGRPIIFPLGTSHVYKALMTFPLGGERPTSIGNDVYSAYSYWMSTFCDYVEIITKQNLTRGGGSRRSLDQPELFYWEGNGKTCRAYTDEVVEPYTITITNKDVSLKRNQFRQICKYCSEARQPKLEYRVMLGAYRALRSGDNRKAIIESATAAEICLTNRIEEEFERRKIDFGSNLLGKFRMLSGRIDLARILGIGLPDMDYKSGLIEPRNYVVHKAHFPHECAATEVIELVEGLLEVFSPDIAETKK